jgi:hypothetical protein
MSNQKEIVNGCDYYDNCKKAYFKLKNKNEILMEAVEKNMVDLDLDALEGALEKIKQMETGE